MTALEAIFPLSYYVPTSSRTGEGVGSIFSYLMDRSSSDRTARGNSEPS